MNLMMVGKMGGTKILGLYQCWGRLAFDKDPGFGTGGFVCHLFEDSTFFLRGLV